jgi:K+-transporting ATPase ATPase C chain
MNNQLRPAIVVFSSMTVLTGALYPLVVTGIGGAAFPHQARGSLVSSNGKLIGSELIGQHVADPHYFWSRPSATSPMPYNASASSGSNQGPLNPAFIDAVKGRVEALRAADPGNSAPVPVDLVTASASGLDPDISLAAANYQVNRVARSRNLSADRVGALVSSQAEGRALGVFGEPRVNVLKLNLALDRLGKRVSDGVVARP